VRECQKIIFKTVTTGFILSLPSLLAAIVSRHCRNAAYLSGCGLVEGISLILATMILYLLSIGYLYNLYKKINVQRSKLIVFLSNFTLLTIFILADFFEGLRMVIFFQVIYPSVHLLYYYMFNTFLPRIDK
jgi:hypothetical protein